MPLKTLPQEEPTLNLISMIDVMLVLTVFFMAATRFIEEDHRIDIKIPTVKDKGALTSAPDPKVVSVYPDGQVALSGKTVTLEELTNRLSAARSQYSGLTVLVRGDKAATHGRMTEVYDACRRAGVAELAISVKLDTKQR
ncbi:MAG TPA: biopolymer transporter ExbD [Pirellulales bacterium]|jgi:biopolymer transport protein ExbD|nr:biopolymer transporter ExbD [Pirellulales bacterium]